MKSSLLRLYKEEDGATMVEYGLMLGLVMIACIVVVSFLSVGVSTIMKNNAEAINDATSRSLGSGS